MLAFHNEPAVKAACLERLYEHRRLDQIAQGFSSNGEEGAGWKGCHWGCLAHDGQGRRTVGKGARLPLGTGPRWWSVRKEFGIPWTVGVLLEDVFESLAGEMARNWVTESIEAIPVGADLGCVHLDYVAWLIELPEYGAVYNSGGEKPVQAYRQLAEWCRQHRPDRASRREMQERLLPAALEFPQTNRAASVFLQMVGAARGDATALEVLQRRVCDLFSQPEPLDCEARSRRRGELLMLVRTELLRLFRSAPVPVLEPIGYPEAAVSVSESQLVECGA